MASAPVTGSHRNEGRRAGGRSPMQILADAVDTYIEPVLARWWERFSDGQRQLTWSTGSRDLRKLAELTAETSHENIAAEDLGADTRLELIADTWECVERAHLGPGLLTVAEAGGIHAAGVWLATRGLSQNNNLTTRRRSSGDPVGLKSRAYSNYRRCHS